MEKCFLISPLGFLLFLPNLQSCFNQFHKFSNFQKVCLKPCSCAQFASGCKFAPGSKFTPGANLHPLASRSYANKSCSYVPRFYLKFNTRYIVLWSNSLCLNVLCGSDPLSLRVMCVRNISIAGVGLKRLHSIHIKARKA